VRLSHLAIAFVFVSAHLIWAQIHELPDAEGQIVGTVLDPRGQPLEHIFVHAVLEKTGMYMPTAESDDTGQFVIGKLQPGIYNVFAESDALGFPNAALSFYSRQEPARANVEKGEVTTVVLTLGPVAGVLAGTVVDKMTGKSIVSKHAPHFTVRKVANPEDSIEFSGPPKFRWLIPPGTEVTLEVCAEGYRAWSYVNPVNPTTLLPIWLESGEEKTLKVELQRDKTAASSAASLSTSPCDI
jgi:hypothetical protein